MMRKTTRWWCPLEVGPRAAAAVLHSPDTPKKAILRSPATAFANSVEGENEAEEEEEEEDEGDESSDGEESGDAREEKPPPAKRPRSGPVSASKKKAVLSLTKEIKMSDDEGGSEDLDSFIEHDEDEDQEGDSDQECGEEEEEEEEEDEGSKEEEEGGGRRKEKARHPSE